MRYILCLLPPIAVIFSTKNPVMWVLSFILTVAGYLPGVILALFVVNKYYADKRSEKQTKAMVRAIEKQGE